MERSLPLEQSFGMEYYSTSNLPIGGKLKETIEDFLVSEITTDGRVLDIKNSLDSTCYEISGERDRFITMDVQKDNLTTMDVATILASELKLPRQLVTYAGLKDKRAITIQQMSIPSSVSSQLPDIFLSRIFLSNLSYTHHPIQIGDLWGNQFTIHLTNLDTDQDTALDAANSLAKVTLLNYFGVQRFGVLRPPTHMIGKALVKKNFEEAIRIMLTTTNEFESDELKELRTNLLASFEFNEHILEEFPQNLRPERNIISFLIKHPGEYERAINRIPHRIQTLMVHSYQSYLFNKLLSKRKRQNLPVDAPISGDFVIRLDRPHSGRDSWSYVTERNYDTYTENVESGKHALACPILGYSTKTPPSLQTDMMNEILHSEEIELKDFRNPSNRYLNSAGGFHLASIDLQGLNAHETERGICLRFRLRKGSYATVVMREIMRNHPINRI